MSLFHKFFGIKQTQSKEHIQNDERGKYMPDLKLPIDERFTVNFKANGGKFLYCENMDEIHKSFSSIINENNWQDSKVFLINDQLKHLFNSFNLNSTKTISEGSFFLSTCEYLISDDGALLITSNQIAQNKLIDLPEHFVIFATTSQMVENIGDGLKGIKQSCKNQSIPTNISTIKHFKPSDENNFLTYGTKSKNLYLLLLEDL